MLQWLDMLGFGGDMTTEETKRARVMEWDGVHLTEKANRNAAVSLCTMLMGRRLEKMDCGRAMKRARW